VAAAHQRRGRRRLRGRPGRDRLVQAAEEVRESEANLVDLFAWPKMARRRQRRAAKLWRRREQQRKKREMTVALGLYNRGEATGERHARLPDHREAAAGDRGAPGSRPKATGVRREVAPCRWRLISNKL
jgi:hypothetical protein